MARKESVDGADVVEVAVREEDERGREALFLEERVDRLRLRAGVDDPRRRGILPEDHAVRANRPKGHDSPFHVSPPPCSTAAVHRTC